MRILTWEWGNSIGGTWKNYMKVYCLGRDYWIFCRRMPENRFLGAKFLLFDRKGMTLVEDDDVKVVKEKMRDLMADIVAKEFAGVE